jgi:hypothetical protein
MNLMESPLRFRAFVAWLLIIPLTFALKYYNGAGEWWLNNWGSSFGYEIFFMLLALMIVPRRSAVTPIAICVCVATCALEFMQLWQPAWLQSIRSTLIGRGLLGTTFQWWDLPAYPIGCILGWVLLRTLTGKSTSQPSTESARQ